MSKKIINGYELKSGFTTARAGTSKWTFATKNGKEFFIKEFFSPVYPIDDEFFTQKQIEKKKKYCKCFEERKRNVYKRINEASNGNLNCIEAFFREGSKYYVVTERIEAYEYRAGPHFPKEKKYLLCILIAHTLKSLHEKGVVHADLKLSNVLFTKSTNSNNWVVKLIDFDNSFLKSCPPEDADDLMMDQFFCAPETYRFVLGEGDVPDEKIDIFALGLIFHFLLTGRYPDFGDYLYAFEAVSAGVTLGIAPEIDTRLGDMIKRMLSFNPKDRPSSSEIFSKLQEIITGKSMISEKHEIGSKNTGSRLKGDLMRKREE